MNNLIQTLKHPSELIGKTITHVQMADFPNEDQFNMIVLDGKYPFYAAGWQDLSDIQPQICNDSEQEIVESFLYYEENIRWLSDIGILNYDELRLKYNQGLNNLEEKKKEKNIAQLVALIHQYPDVAQQILAK